MLVNIRVSAGTSSSNGLSVLEQQGSKVKRGPQAARPLFGGVGLTCGGAPGEAGRPAAISPTGDDARAGGGVARPALDRDAVPGFVGRPWGAIPEGP